MAVESFEEVDCMTLRAEVFSWAVEAAAYRARAAWIESEREESISTGGSKGGGP